MEWISVEKALPSSPNDGASNVFERVKVLVWDGKEWGEAGYDLHDKKFYDLSDWPGYEITGVTHWAIPEPPNT